MAQPPSDRASANPTTATLAGAASVRVAHVAVRLSGDSAAPKKDAKSDAAHDQKDKRKHGAAAFSSDVILVTSEDLRLCDGDDAGSDDDASGRVHIPPLEFS